MPKPEPQKAPGAKQTTRQVECGRCGGARWVPDPFVPIDRTERVTGVPVPLVEPYICGRCMAGDPEVEVKPKKPATAAQLANLEKARAASREKSTWRHIPAAGSPDAAAGAEGAATLPPGRIQILAGA